MTANKLNLELRHRTLGDCSTDSKGVLSRVLVGQQVISSKEGGNSVAEVVAT